MSDNRDQAQQEMVEAGIAGGMEDSLASSLSTSFTLPPPAPKAEAPLSHPPNPTIDIPDPEIPSSEPGKPIPGMAEWKDTLESYNTTWHAESAEARTKAEETRKRIEDENIVAKKAEADEIKKAKAAEKAKEEEKKRQERLSAELAAEDAAGGSSGSRKGKKGKKALELELAQKAEREQKVKEAWELVKDSSAPAEEGGVVHAGDARGVMDEDVRAGQAIPAGKDRPSVVPPVHDSTTSTEPLPPSMQSAPPSPVYTMPSESQTLSRHSATSQAWEEISTTPSSSVAISPPSSSASNGQGQEHMNVPRSTNPLGRGMTDPVPTNITSGGLSQADAKITGSSPSRPTGSQRHPQSQHQNQNTPPAQPPSLTLSIFTMPGHLSVSRIFAVLGINLVLPFINGVMLGFGEIFAREAVRVGRLVWRGERSLFGRSSGAGDRDIERGGFGRGVAGVGLSGSGGF